MMKKSLALLLSLAMVVIMLAGCSGGASKETNNDAGTADTASSDAGSTDAGANTSAASGEDVTLTVFDGQAYGLERYDELVKSFEESHPGVKVEVQHAANDTDTLLKARINSDDVPDVFAVQTGTQAKSYYDFAYDWTNDTDVLAKFNQAAVDTGKDADGNVKSLPWTYENMGLIYNKDLFQKAGITEVPTTISQLEDACKKLDAAGITAFSLAAKETWVLGQLATHFLMDKSKDAAGTVAAMNDGSLTFDTAPNFKNLFKVLDLAVKYGPDKPLEIDWETSENMLANGEAAIIHMGDWCQATLDKFNPNANLAFLPVPVSENPDDTNLLSSISWTYIVNKDSKNLDLAKEYLQYILTSDEGLDWMCNTIGSVPSAAGEHKVAGKLANDAAAYISAGKTNGWIHTSYPDGYNDSTMGPTLQAYMLGDLPVKDAIASLQAGWVTQ
ncbi:ABC transporter substrate-binding protein [Anaerocolumna sp. MB42-C2]|uniref:ABC transporter substrate-binding protein n=1 Tax=Anaerocolumna sp. MB42-C2 TaxID=3070997 RepID=UPI0027E1946A|nr:extracellular solute-binding protein [Anaerocolumna sp. MB42-C2]WMJ90530.1 extracellular solute-binding protein [Anaerocolumna sp. MB42-C2]